MTTSSFTLHPSVFDPGPGIWFAVPAGFVQVPLDALLEATGEVREGRIPGALTPLLESAPDEAARNQLIAQLGPVEQMLRNLTSEGTTYCSLGLHRDDTTGESSGPLLSFLTVTWVHTAWAPRRVTVARIVATAHGHSEVGYGELACGPAAFSEIVRTTPAESGLPQGPLLQIHAHLPHPDGRSLAILTLSTVSVVHREHYRAVLREIAEFVSFDDPLVPDSAGGADDLRESQTPRPPVKPQ